MSEVLKDALNKKIDSGMDSVITLQGGAAVDMIDIEISKVVQNICDINTSMGPRKIKLELHAIPMDENRNMIKWKIHVPPAQLCGQDPKLATSEVQIDANGRGFYSKEKQTNQLPMMDGNGNVTPMVIGGK